jgi:hypothetical protein
MESRSALVGCALALVSGCAGAFGGYGPGMTNEQRTNVGCTPDAPGSSWGTCRTRSYDSADLEYGIQLGARVGAVSASAGSIRSGYGLGIDAHVDIVVAAARWGVGVTTGYTSDRLFGTANGGDFFYSGLPVGVYGQLGLTRKIFLHGGAGRVLDGSVKRVEPNEISVDASAWRGFAGITFVVKRSRRSDLALRFEVRMQRSSSAEIDGQDATWSSTGLLGELVWASF